MISGILQVCHIQDRLYLSCSVLIVSLEKINFIKKLNSYQYGVITMKKLISLTAVAILATSSFVYASGAHQEKVHEHKQPSTLHQKSTKADTAEASKKVHEHKQPSTLHQKSTKPDSETGAVTKKIHEHGMNH